MAFRFIEDGPERGDCTRRYKIDLGRRYAGTPYDVHEFISEILGEHSGDWGHIKIVDQNGDLKCWTNYKYGEMFIPLPNDIYLAKVKTVSADGGWTNMDYVITIDWPIIP